MGGVGCDDGNDKNEHHAQDDDIVSIHREIRVATATTKKKTRESPNYDNDSNTTKESKRAKLNALRRKRIALAARVKFQHQKMKLETKTTVNDVALQLPRKKGSIEEDMTKKTLERPYLNPCGNNVGFQELRAAHRDQQQREDHHCPAVVHNNNNNTGKGDSEGSATKTTEGTIIQKARLLRKISAAYRLAGISLCPCPDDENVIIIRLDISVGGVYVDCHKVFFELVLCGDKPGVTTSYGDELYLRLAQHTIPPSIPLPLIIEETLGGRGRRGILCNIGPLQDDNQWQVKDLQLGLRRFSNQLYQACYCLAVRRQAYQLLKSRNRTVDRTEPGPDLRQLQRNYHIADLSSSVSWDKLSFHLKLNSGIASLMVELKYQDPMCPQPTIVIVKNNASTCSPSSLSTRNQKHSITEVSDDDDHDEDKGEYDDQIETARIAFRRLPMEKAIEEVNKAMEEW